MLRFDPTRATRSKESGRGVKRRSAEDEVTETLRRAIREGVLAPGMRLAQVEMARKLGVSRIPLRDALRRLEAESLVEVDSRRRARVTVLSPEDLDEIYEMRISLEPVCIDNAVSHLTEAAAARLAARATGNGKVLTPSGEFNRRRAFYSDLYTYAHRPHIKSEVMRLRDAVGRYQLLAHHDPSTRPHHAFADAIAERNADRATRLFVEHTYQARSSLLAALASAG